MTNIDNILTEKRREVLADEHKLTPRELEVLQQAVLGSGNKAIGLFMKISTRTVSKHFEHILAKLNVRTRTAAVVMFMSIRLTEKEE